MNKPIAIFLYLILIALVPNNSSGEGDSGGSGYDWGSSHKQKYFSSNPDTRHLNEAERKHTNDDYSVRVTAAKGLIGKTDEDSLKYIELVLNDPSNEIRSIGAIALKGRIEEKALQLLEKALLDQDNSVKAQAALALQGRSDPKSLKMITKIIKNENENSTVKVNAVSALKGRTENEIINLLELAFEDKSILVKQEVLKSLEGRNDQKSLEIIKKGIKGERLVAHSINALKGRTDEASFHYIKELANSKQNDIKSFTVADAIQTLVNRTDEESLNFLKEILNDKNKDIALRNASIFTLKNRGDPDRTLAILKAAASKDMHDEFQRTLNRAIWYVTKKLESKSDNGAGGGNT